MTTPTQLQQLARETAEKLMVYQHSTHLQNHASGLILSALEQVSREERKEAQEPIDGDTDASIGRSWRENSSLEKWFPFTAQEIKDLRKEAQALAEDKALMDWLEQNGELEHLYEEGRPETTVPVIRVASMNFDFEGEDENGQPCILTVRAAINQARAALAAWKEKQP